MCGMTSYLNGFVLLVYCLTVPILFHCTNPEEPLWGLYSAWLQKEFVTQQDTVDSQTLIVWICRAKSAPNFGRRESLFYI
jgi:hypothetical protein